jgi:tetratricopeptide (TPR) repeat protein
MSCHGGYHGVEVVAADSESGASSSSWGNEAEHTEPVGAAASSSAFERPQPLERGASVGRYLIVELIGAGGMGEVYRAYDPQLDRKVALKVLRVAGPESIDGARVLREARALARQNHANVVTVYDAGIDGERVHIAMELVEGETLAQWLKERHGWRETLALFIGAGRGLAAAHASGLVHRDFKPQNVMVSREGQHSETRVRVMDFGLARAAVGRESDAVVTVAGANELPLELTAAGTLVGTPAYLAPEVYAGQTADERADQFSFCVALWLGLFGTRPFVGDVAFELAAAAARGDIAPPPSTSTVPTWLRKVALRGLAARPQDRWADMTTLLAALQRDPSRRRRVVVVLAAVAGAAALVLGTTWAAAAARSRACDDEGRSIDLVWNDATAEIVRERFVATGLELAEPTFARARERLDAYAEQWSTAAREICMRDDAASEASTISACMQARRSALAKTVDVFLRAEDRDVIAAIGAATRLGAISDCRDDAYLAGRAAASQLQGTPEERDAIERGLAECDALLDLGRYDEGVAVAEHTLAAAEELGAAGLVANVRAQLGDALFLAGDVDRAKNELMSAYFAASAVGDDRTASAAARRIFSIVGEQGGRTDDALLWSRLAETAIARDVGDTTLARANLLSIRARVDQVAGDLPAAVADARAALELTEAFYGTEHPDVASALNTLGAIYLQQGDDRAAEAAFERGLALVERTYGDSHPEVARFLHNLAGVSYRRVDLAKTRALTERSLEIKLRWFGAESREVANSLVGLGNLELREGRFAEAQDHFGRALAIYRRIHSGDHPVLLEVLANLAHAEHGAVHLETAEALYRERLAMAERLFGGEHVKVADALVDLSSALAYRRADREAEALMRRALAIYEKTVPPDHPSLVEALDVLGKQLVDQGRDREAIGVLERSLKVQEAQAAVDPLYRARARYHLARAVWNAERDAARARELADGAKTDYEAAGEAAAQEQRKLTTWRKAVPELRE